MKQPLKYVSIITLLLFSSILTVYSRNNDEIKSSIKNIEVFTRLYGYVKYFYPGDEAANTDWDRFAVYGVKRMEKVQNRLELHKALEELFLPIAPALVIRESNKKTKFSLAAITPSGAEKMKVVVWQHLGVGFGNPQDIYRSTRLNRPDNVNIKPALPGKPLFDEKPGIGEYIGKKLGSGLSCLMPIALYGTNTRTFPPASLEDLNRLETAIKQEIPYSKELSVESLYVRLAGIVISWNIFQHFYPYFSEADADWQQALPEALLSAYKDKTQLDYLETLNEMLAHLEDGQAGAYLPGNYSRMYLPPVNWAWVQGQLVITDVYEKKRIPVRVGDVVVEIDGKKAGEALEIKGRGISAATKGWKRFRALEELLRGKQHSKIHLKIKRGKPPLFYNETVTRSAFSPEYFGYIQKRKKQSGRLEAGIWYLNLDLTPMAEVNRLMPELQKARSIICDFRGSPKGSHLLLSHLLKEKEISRLFWIPQVIYPDYKNVTYKKAGWILKPLKPPLTAKMIFIADNRTIDYGESILSYIEHYRLGTIVGQPTAGTCGSGNSFYLFGRFFIRWTAVKTVKHDGSTLHGKGIIPHSHVEPTIKGIKQRRDELLKKALEIAKQ